MKKKKKIIKLEIRLLGLPNKIYRNIKMLETQLLMRLDVAVNNRHADSFSVTVFSDFSLCPLLPTHLFSSSSIVETFLCRIHLLFLNYDDDYYYIWGAFLCLVHCSPDIQKQRHLDKKICGAMVNNTNNIQTNNERKSKPERDSLANHIYTYQNSNNKKKREL